MTENEKAVLLNTDTATRLVSVAVPCSTDPAIEQSNASLIGVDRLAIREAGSSADTSLNIFKLRWHLRLLYLMQLTYWGIRHRSISSALWVVAFEGRSWN